MRKLLLVSPHSDDILFSAANFLFATNDFFKFDKIVLFTVENNEKRLTEDNVLKEIFNLQDIITSKNLVEADISYYHYYKEMNFKDFNLKDAEACINDYFGKEKAEEIETEVHDTVKEYVNKNYTVVSCLGVGHPTHYLVRKATENLADYFYRDFPHSYKRKGKKNFDEFTSDLSLVTEKKLSEEIHKLQYEIFYKTYKTQRSLLFFEKGYIDKNLPEQFYSKS